MNSFGEPEYSQVQAFFDRCEAAKKSSDPDVRKSMINELEPMIRALDDQIAALRAAANDRAENPVVHYELLNAAWNCTKRKMKLQDILHDLRQ